MFKVDERKKDQKKDQNFFGPSTFFFGPSLPYAIRLVKEGPKKGPKVIFSPFLNKMELLKKLILALKYTLSPSHRYVFCILAPLRWEVTCIQREGPKISRQKCQQKIGLSVLLPVQTHTNIERSTVISLLKFIELLPIIVASTAANSS